MVATSHLNETISSSWKWNWKSLNRVRLLVTPWAVVHGILQARILEWVAFPFSRDLPNPGIKSRSLFIAGGFLPTEPQEQPQVVEMNHLPIRVLRWGRRGWWRRAFPLPSISYPFIPWHSQFIRLWSYIKGHENAASNSPTPHSETTTGHDSSQKKLIQAPNTGSNKNCIVLTYLLFIYFLMLEYFFILIF